MLIRSAEAWPLKGASTKLLTCPNCSNTGDHELIVHPYGMHLGVIFRKKPIFTKKQYFWTCPTCQAYTEEMTKEQALSHVGVK